MQSLLLVLDHIALQLVEAALFKQQIDRAADRRSHGVNKGLDAVEFSVCRDALRYRVLKIADPAGSVQNRCFLGILCLLREKRRTQVCVNKRNRSPVLTCKRTEADKLTAYLLEPRYLKRLVNILGDIPHVLADIDARLDVHNAQYGLAELQNRAEAFRLLRLYAVVSHQKQYHIRVFGGFKGNILVLLPVERADSRHVGYTQAVPLIRADIAGLSLRAVADRLSVAVREHLHERGFSRHGSAEKRDVEAAQITVQLFELFARLLAQFIKRLADILDLARQKTVQIRKVDGFSVKKRYRPLGFLTCRAKRPLDNSELGRSYLISVLSALTAPCERAVQIIIIPIFHVVLRCLKCALVSFILSYNIICPLSRFQCNFHGFINTV